MFQKLITSRHALHAMSAMALVLFIVDMKYHC